MGQMAEPVLEAPKTLTGDLCWLLSTGAHSLVTQLTAALEDSGISPRGYAVLRTALEEERTQGEIARLIGLDKTTMVVTLDELEAAGLAERRPSETDRRARVVGVTKAGERKLREADAISERLQEDVLSVLPASEREAFLDSLERLVCARLSEPAPCSKPPRRRAPR